MWMAPSSGSAESKYNRENECRGKRSKPRVSEWKPNLVSLEGTFGFTSERDILGSPYERCFLESGKGVRLPVAHSGRLFYKVAGWQSPSLGSHTQPVQVGAYHGSQRGSLGKPGKWRMGKSVMSHQKINTGKKKKKQTG